MRVPTVTVDDDAVYLNFQSDTGWVRVEAKKIAEKCGGDIARSVVGDWIEACLAEAKPPRIREMASQQRNDAIDYSAATQQQNPPVGLTPTGAPQTADEIKIMAMQFAIQAVRDVSSGDLVRKATEIETYLRDKPVLSKSLPYNLLFLADSFTGVDQYSALALANQPDMLKLIREMADYIRKT